MQKDKEGKTSQAVYSEALFHALFQYMSSCVAVYSAVDNGEDFVFLDFNRAAELADKAARDELVGRRLTECFPNAREFGLVSVLKRVWETGNPEHFPATFYQDNRISGWRDNYVYRLPTGEVVAIYDNVTEQKAAEKELRESHELLDSLLNSMAEGAYGVDIEGNCTFVNQSFLRILGYDSPEEIVGHHIHELIHHTFPDGNHYPSHKCKMYSALSGMEVHERNEVFWRKDGAAVPVEYWSRPIFREGKVVGAIATFLDVTERKKQEALIHDLAFYDALTKLPNRTLLSERLSQSHRALKRSGKYGALLFIDLDNFKPLNDAHGHNMGDLLLKKVAHRIISCLREEDTVARLGGDEFVVLLSGLSKDEPKSSKEAGLVAEKIRLALEKPYLLKSPSVEKTAPPIEHRCSASIGVVMFNHELSQDDLLKFADIAMYEAKKTGRNRVKFYGA